MNTKTRKRVLMMARSSDSSLCVGRPVLVRDGDGELVRGVVEFVKSGGGCNVLVSLERPIYSSCYWWFAKDDFEPTLGGWGVFPPDSGA